LTAKPSAHPGFARNIKPQRWRMTGAEFWRSGRPWLVFLIALVLTGGAWFGGNLSRGETRASTEQTPSDAPNASQESAVRWQLAFEPQTPLVDLTQINPEAMVRQIVSLMVQGDRAQALHLAMNLTQQLPHFQLGQLLYADLLNISASAPMSWAEKKALTPDELDKRLGHLRLEFQRRLQQDDAPSLQGKIPAGLNFLNPRQTYFAAVDVSKSRLYWFENRSASNGPLRLHLVHETYVSIGINGSGKEQEGDGKTPLGVYFILRNLSGDTLPDLYGAGALTLNYPNAVDLMRRKTGSGIWLHGTPSDQYARAPESTDGCVVLSNPDMAQLLQLPNLQMTPVLIANQLDWEPQSPESDALERIHPTVQAWLQDRQSRNAEKLKMHYSQRFERDGKDLTHWWPELWRTSLVQARGEAMEMVSALQWQDGGDHMVVTQRNPSSSSSQGSLFWRTYWQKEEGQWRVVFEGPA
jgi:L,D-transpeptidase YnhG